MSFTGTPASAYFRIDAIWISLDFDFLVQPSDWETMPGRFTSVVCTGKGSFHVQLRVRRA
jgi:hypothetical protein